MKKTIVRVILILIAAGALCASGWCIWYISQYFKGQSFAGEMREAGPKEEIVITADDEESPEAEEPETVVIPVDFDELHGINPDIYAWIEVPGTEISYAVLHREGNNSYYIRRSEDGAYYTGGCIFSEDYNSTDFSDKVTVLYGHNLKNGGMFARLNDFADVEVFDEYQYINIYLPDRVLAYRVFAAVPYSSKHLLAGNDFGSRSVFEDFFSELAGTKSMDAQFREEEFPEFEEDRVLVLSTCYRQDRHARYLVFARLIKELEASR